MRFFSVRVLLGPLVAVALLFAATPALAAPQDYAFEAVQPHVKATADATIVLRLVHLPDRKPVANAVIFQSRLEMPMEGMAPMVAKVSALPPAPDGSYPFKADLAMAGEMPGEWKLMVSAKVQGESGTITGAVPFMIMK